MFVFLFVFFFSFRIAGALVLPERNEAENEVDGLRELPGEQEYYRTSTDATELVPTTYSGDGDDVGSDTEEPPVGSGDGGLLVPATGILPPLPPTDLYTFYFVRVNVDGEENNETDRQWLDFLQSNGVDLTKFQNGNGNFGVHNLMPSADVGAHLIDDKSPINLTEDDMFKMVQVQGAMTAPASEKPNGKPSDKPVEILQTPAEEWPMAVDGTNDETTEDSSEHSLVDQPQYELINETNLHTPYAESPEEDSDVAPHSGDGPIEDISLISQRDRPDDADTSASDDESSGETPHPTTTRSTQSINDSSRARRQKTVDNSKVASIIERYKSLHGWSFWPYTQLIELYVVSVL